VVHEPFHVWFRGCCVRSERSWPSCGGCPVQLVGSGRPGLLRDLEGFEDPAEVAQENKPIRSETIS
jgi:hypothetical protein